jgi:hypothetical protein
MTLLLNEVAPVPANAQKRANHTKNIIHGCFEPIGDPIVYIYLASQFDV